MTAILSPTSVSRDRDSRQFFWQDFTRPQDQNQFCSMCIKCAYRISSYSFRGNYSFLNLDIQRSQYKRLKVRKLFKGGNYSRAETIWGNTVCTFSDYGSSFYRQGYLCIKSYVEFFFSLCNLMIIVLGTAQWCILTRYRLSKLKGWPLIFVFYLSGKI